MRGKVAGGVGLREGVKDPRGELGGVLTHPKSPVVSVLPPATDTVYLQDGTTGLWGEVAAEAEVEAEVRTGAGWSEY